MKPTSFLLMHAATALLGATTLAIPRTTSAAKSAPVNLAPKAAITASGQHSDAYVGRFVADGKIPAPGCRRDTNEAWCIPRNKAVNATLTFQWPAAVTVAEIVYYGRTAWLWDENFLQVRVFVGDASKPTVDLPLKAGHGPQRIPLPSPVNTDKLTLKFPRADKGPNPGSSEVRIYAGKPPQALLGSFAAARARVRVQAQPPEPIEESSELAQKLADGALGFTRILAVQRNAIKPSHVYTYHCEGLRAGGSLFTYDLKSKEITTLLEAGNGVILDCDISYDGENVVFSWMRDMKPFQVYRVGIDGEGLTQLTDDEFYNFNACWLPDGGIAFLSTRRSAFAYCWSSPAGILHRMDADGDNIQQLSANYLNDFTPSVLNDGRIIYSRWEYVDRPAIPIQSLWTINPDGTGLRVYYGNRVLSPATFMEPRAIPGSDRLLCMLTAHNGPCRGAVGIIDRRKGVNEQGAIRNLTPEVNIGEVNRGSGNHVRGPYQSLYPVDENYFFVTKGGTLQVRDYECKELATVLAKGTHGVFNAQPIRPRFKPPVIPGNIGEKAPTNAWATVYLQNVYEGLEPHVKPGEIKQIRVVQEIAKPVSVSPNRRLFGFQFPVVSCGATYAPKKIWGSADVAEDGSAGFYVPVNVPVYFMALDAEGMAVQRMRSFTHMVPGEMQGCIGCHENRRHTAAMTVRPKAALRSPRTLKEPEWGARGFDYATIVQPVLNEHCVKCHNARQQPNGVDLTGDKTDIFNVSYEILARKGTPAENPGRGGAANRDFRNPYTSWISTYNGSEDNILEITPRAWGSPASRLAELVRTGHPDAEGRPRIALTDAERRRIYAWIDCNVPYYPTSASNDINRKGCRRIYPDNLDKVLADVASRRCAECHKGGKVPRPFYTRITNPQDNVFLLAPLAKSAKGTEACGRAVFANTDDPDYRAILATFDPVARAIEDCPRVDME